MNCHLTFWHGTLCVQKLLDDIKKGFVMLTPEPDCESSGDKSPIKSPCKGHDLMPIKENQVSVL